VKRLYRCSGTMVRCCRQARGRAGHARPVKLRRCSRR